MDHITCIHGIHTGLTDPGWTGRFSNRLQMLPGRIATESEHYYATAIAPWNLWVKNPRYARALSNRIAEFCEQYTTRRRTIVGPHVTRDCRVSLVSHSNGTNIALDVVRRLARQGIGTQTLVVVGSALHSDIERNGMRELVSRGHLRRVVAYCSDDDRVIRPLQWIPGFYGSLGTRGLELDGSRIGLSLHRYEPLEPDTPQEWGRDRYRYVTRWFPGFRHSQWWEPDHQEETFDCLLSDLGLTPPGGA